MANGVEKVNATLSGSFLIHFLLAKRFVCASFRFHGNEERDGGGFFVFVFGNCFAVLLSFGTMSISSIVCAIPYFVADWRWKFRYTHFLSVFPEMKKELREVLE